MDNLTPRAQQALALARKISGNLKQNYIGCEHLTAALLTLCPAYKEAVKLQDYFNELDKLPKIDEAITFQPYTPRVKKVLALSGKIAKQFNHAFVACDHLMLATLREREGHDKRILKTIGVDVDKLEKDIMTTVSGGIDTDELITCMIASNPIKGDAMKAVSVEPKKASVKLDHWQDVIGKTIESIKSVTINEGYSEYVAGGGQGGQSTTHKLIITFTDGCYIEHTK